MGFRENKKKTSLKPKRKAKKKRPAKPLPKKSKKRFFKIVTKIHAGFTVLMLLLYVTLGVIGGPEFLLRDVADKYQAIAATTRLSVRIVGPPEKPVVTATSSCLSSSPRVHLAWQYDVSTDTYDIYRNGNPLITGVTDLYYDDNNVQALTAYTYFVTAQGLLGSNQSDDVAVTTGECYVPPDPTCKIVTIEGKNISRYDGTPKIEDRRPSFTGTTNLSDAQIKIKVTGGPTIIANTTANGNGYWDWTVPKKLDYGNHTIYVTATDPDDEERDASDSQKFIILEKAGETPTVPTTPVTPTEPGETPTPPGGEEPTTPEEPTKNVPLEITLKVTNQDKLAYAGETLDVSLKLKRDPAYEFPKDQEITYYILDENRGVIDEWSEKLPADSDAFQKKINLPKLMKAGSYKIGASVTADGMMINSEDSFKVKERTLINLGGGFILTYSELLKNIGWLAFAMLLVLLLFLILLMIEHHLSAQAVSQITEEILRKKGVISRRKEVAK